MRRDAFDTVPDWGIRPDGNSAIGPTHGSVVIDKEGNIYTSSDQGVFIFSPDGKVVHNFLGTDDTGLHDMEIRAEGEAEFIYGARNKAGEGNGVKEFNTAHGMTIDTRYDPPRLLICDRNHQPKGRLVH